MNRDNPIHEELQLTRTVVVLKESAAIKIRILTFGYEFVQFNHVHPLGVQWNFLTEPVIFGSKEYSDDDFGFFVAVDVDGVGERSVVQPSYAGLDFDVRKLNSVIKSVQ